MTAPVPPAAPPATVPAANNENDEIEEGELSGPGSPVIPTVPVRRAREYDDDMPSRKRARTGKARAPEPNDDDFWDDSEVVAAWDSAIDRWRRMQRGEPVSDSEDEDEEYDEDGEVAEDDLDDPTAAADDGAALPTTDETEGQLDLDDDGADASPTTDAVAAGTAVPQVVADAAHLSDTDVLLHLQHAWYCAGYYAGILEQRRVAAGGAPPQDGDVDEV
ncbi:hypothetical protein AMAG_11248 [Allomyces macrogynus ATCC 38327]|uniref:Survival motor neuron Tudor domain-containing protein n=1 Tax=Allomyces macrogynus (strain ATCC 38327) TaxID=578462 RepID=A0A0L0SWA3_ALLM3|nr:hypothetical protein AMAG_11248 [Allomyces macrogynus ATCC 38327]|eukprot:KNE66751.1 hypothetical protein AMAG_11248 [Allomyces macrogynus ATCC 38327]